MVDLQYANGYYAIRMLFLCGLRKAVSLQNI